MTTMSISDRLDQIERESVEANEHLMLDALRAVLDVCDIADGPDVRPLTDGVRDAIAAALGEES